MRVREGYSGASGVVPVDDPTYLVEIWQPSATWTESNHSWQCAEYELEDCSVDEVLRWAAANTPDDERARYVVHACYRPPGTAHDPDIHIWLIGADPTRDTTPVRYSRRLDRPE